MDDIAAKHRTPRQNLKKEAETYLRDLIHSGELKPGQRLDQDRIASDLGFSRLPVREALITLESEGLVENIARRGSFVAHIEPDDILDHYRMYGCLSGIAAARVATLQPAEVLDRLQELNDKMRSASDTREHDRLNFLFHQAINRAGGTRRLIAVLKVISASMPTDYFQHNNEWEYRNQAQDEHDKIIKVIRAGDAEGAARALEDHFIHTGNQAVSMLKSSGFWDKD